jgi:hypothetical protein
MSTNQSALQRRLLHERRLMATSIESQLRHLRQCVDSALDRLKDGQALDPHMIANHVILTHEITRWNIAIDLQPYADDPDHGGKTKGG